MIYLWKKPQAAPKKTAAQYILGVSVSPEGSSAAMLRDGKTIFSAFEPPAAGGGAAAFPAALVTTALEKSSEAEGEILGVKDMAAVAFCGKPLLEYDRYRREWLAAAPAGFRRFLESAPYAFNKKDLGEGLLARELSAASWGETPARLLYPEHLLACAASAFYASPFDASAILVLDGPCEDTAAAICLGSGEKVKVVRELIHPDSPQLLSSSLAAYAGFGGNSAGGLFTAPGAADQRRCEDYYAKIIGELARLREDGSVRLDRRYFSEAEGMKPDHARWKELFGEGPFTGTPLAGARLDFAAAARAALEEMMFRLGAQTKRLAFSTNLCLCAGPELKLAAEGKLKASGLFSRIWSPACRAAEGKAAGAALAARHVYFGIKRQLSAGSGWGEEPEPEPPQAAAATLELKPARPLSPLARLKYTLYFWLKVLPSARKGGAGGAEGEPVNPSSYYAVRPRIYDKEDLENPG